MATMTSFIDGMYYNPFAPEEEVEILRSSRFRQMYERHERMKQLRAEQRPAREKVFQQAVSEGWPFSRIREEMKRLNLSGHNSADLHQWFKFYKWKFKGVESCRSLEES